MLEIVGGFLVAVLLLTFVVRLVFFRKRRNYSGKHVVITGGSEGIGRSLAERFFKEGAKVTIMARTKTKLETAKEEIKKLKGTEGSSIEYVCLDVTKPESVSPAMEAACEFHGDIDVLCVAAGKAYPGYFIEQDENIFSRCMELNYMGTVRCVKAVVPLMLACTGFVGYSSYSPTKFAVRGFADALRNELKGTHISVHMCYPPDTDTPGFKEENLTKPKETNECFPPEVFSSEAVSDSIFDGMSRDEYHIMGPDPGINLLISNMVGLTPRSRWFVLEFVLQPVIILVSMVLTTKIDGVTGPYGRKLKKMHLSKPTQKKAD